MKFQELLNEACEVNKLGYPIPALYMVFSLVDRCSKVAYHDDKSVGFRFKKWIEGYVYNANVGLSWYCYFHGDEFLEQYESSLKHIAEHRLDFQKKFADEMYTLRCNLMHEGDICSEYKNRIYEDNGYSPITFGNVNTPYGYEIIDVSSLVGCLSGGLEKYYSESPIEIKQKLDEFGRSLVKGAMTIHDIFTTSRAKDK